MSLSRLPFASAPFVLYLLVFASPPAEAQTPQRGLPPYGSLEPGTIDTINRQDLNTFISLPVSSTAGRGLGFNMQIFYNSLIWYPSGGAWTPNGSGWNTNSLVGGSVTYTTRSSQQNCGPAVPTPGPMWLPASFAPRRAPPPRYRAYYGTKYTYSNYVYTEQNGTRHTLPITGVEDGCGAGYSGTAANTTDGSGFRGDATQSADATVRDRSGALLFVNSAVMKDPNGNYISYTTPSGEIDYTDTAGHLALKIVTSSSNVKYEYQDTTGAYQTITLNLATYNVKTAFNCTGVAEYTGNWSLPSSLVYPNGWTYSFTYEATPNNSGYITGRLSKITLPNGGYIQYTFGATNDGINCSDGSVVNLTRATYDGTNTATWQFARAQNGSNWQTTITYPLMPYDSAANQTVYTLNSSGQEISEQFYQGSSSTGTLLRTANTTWASNGSPATRTTVLEDNTTQSEVETTYDSNGQLQTLKEHDYGSGAPGAALRTTNYTYLSTSAYTNLNILGRVTEKTVADSTGTIQYREDFAYDGTTINPCPAGVAQHDDTNYGCSFTTRGNRTSMTTYTNAAAPSGAVTKNSYFDVFGNLVKADVDCCQSQTWTFSSATTYAYPDSTTRGASGGTQLTTSYTYNAYTGQLASTTDPNGQQTSNSYDLMRRLTTITRPDQTQLGYSFDDVNHTESETGPIQGSSVVKRTKYLDGLGRSMKETIFDGSGTSYQTIQTQYDPLGRPYKECNPHNSTAQYWTETDFDGLGRTTKTILQDNSAYTYAYSGPSTTTTDPARKQLKEQLDGLGRTSIVFEPDVNNNNSLTIQTSFAYSVLDKIASVTEGSQTRTFNFDGMGRLTSQTTPEAGTVSFQYNNFNKQTQKTDALGVVANYQYDSLNRIIGLSYTVPNGSGIAAMPNVCNPTGGTANSNVCIYWDEGGASANALGHMTHRTDPSGTDTYTYDPHMVRVTQVQHLINGTNYTVGYQYNLDGEFTAVTYPSGRVVQRTYDAASRLSSISSGTTTYASGIQFDPAFNITRVNYGNGIIETLAYSADRMQPVCVDHATQNSSGQCQASQYSLFSLTYGYTQNSGNNGQITSITDAVDSGRTVNYNFDALNRITSAVTNGSTGYAKWGLSFSFDRYGNRLSQTVTAGSGPSISVSVDPTTNRITTSGYSYDADGHLTNDGVNALTYDAEDRIVSTSGGGGSATYAHRPTGHRVMKTSGGNTTVYVYSQNRLIAEYVNGTLTEEYIYLGHRMIAEYASGTLYYHHSDHLSDRMITDASGNKVGEQAHYPFGETWYSNNTTTKFHLTSYERDAESGNDYARHRFHVNRLGRFSSADPIAGCSSNPQGLNRFSYVGNDPINRTDPVGLCWNIWLPCCPLWWGCGMDDEGDCGAACHYCCAGGDCDPTIDDCGEPPPGPDPDCVLTPRPNAFNILLCAPGEKFKLTLGLGGPVTGTTPPHNSKINSVTATAVEDWFRANPGKASPVLPNEFDSWETWFNVVKSVKGGTVGHVTWDVNYTCKGNPYDVTFTLAQVRCAQPSK